MREVKPMARLRPQGAWMPAGVVVCAVPDNYKILFIGGGATMQFGMIPMNFWPMGELPITHLLELGQKKQ